MDGSNRIASIHVLFKYLRSIGELCACEYDTGNLAGVKSRHPLEVLCEWHPRKGGVLLIRSHNLEDWEMGELLYLTGRDGLNSHGDRRWMDQMGLRYGFRHRLSGKVYWKDSLVPSLLGECEFYPLTPSEAVFVSYEEFDSSLGPVQLGYSVLYKGEKYLAPTLELDDIVDARNLAFKIDPVLKAWGGRSIVDTESTNKVLLVGLVPVHAVFNLPVERYHLYLNKVFA